MVRFEPKPLPELTATTGVYPIDIDNDRALDLVVLRVGLDMILRGDGNCTFTPMELEGVTFEDKWSTAFSATWESTNTLPTLAFGHYVDRKNPDGPFEACDTNLLLRPNGETYSAKTLAPGYCPLSMLFSDWSRDGVAELRVSNDRHYYVNNGSEQLWDIAETPRLYGEDDGWINHKVWGMGIASRDIDRNGLIDVFLSSMGDQRLQEWTGKDAEFKDVSFKRGATAHKPYTGGDGRPSTGWHISLGDVQNDGRDDVFIAKGNVQQMPGMAIEDPNNLLIQNEDTTFSEAGLEAGIASLHRSRGAALADFNADGLLDLAVVNRVAPLEVYRNTTKEAGNWLSIEPRQQGANTRAIGGWIELMDDYGLQLREITLGVAMLAEYLAHNTLVWIKLKAYHSVLFGLMVPIANGPRQNRTNVCRLYVQAMPWISFLIDPAADHSEQTREFPMRLLGFGGQSMYLRMQQFLRPLFLSNRLVSVHLPQRFLQPHQDHA